MRQEAVRVLAIETAGQDRFRVELQSKKEPSAMHLSLWLPERLPCSIATPSMPADLLSTLGTWAQISFARRLCFRSKIPRAGSTLKDECPTAKGGMNEVVGCLG